MTAPVYFCSGASAPADLRGLARIRHPLGVSIPKLSGPAIDFLCSLQCVDVFVDSGVFSEVDRRGAVVAPITDDEWITRTGVMHRIAAALGPRAMIVAPDRVGDQQETLRRLALCADVVRACATLGARVIVPIQRGGMSAALFDDACSCLLGIDFVRGIPGNKAAMPSHELETFLRVRRPRAVHLLGIGPRGDRFRPLVALLQRLVPGAAVSCDSNGLAALVGSTNGPGGGARALTSWQATTKDRGSAIVMALGPQLFFDKALAAYGVAGLEDPRGQPAQLGLFDEQRAAQ